MAFCTKCGAKIEDGQVCTCSLNTEHGPNISETLNNLKEKAADVYSQLGTRPAGERCANCGRALVDGICPDCTTAQTQTVAAQAVNPDSKFKAFFMNPQEKMVCVLGNNYMQNFLSGGNMFKAFSVVSDKRVYFRGTLYEMNGRTLQKVKCSHAVNIRDVTGVGVTYHSPIAFIVVAVLAVILAFLSIMIWWAALILFGIAAFCGLMYFFKRKTLLQIQYAGGGLCFDILWFSEKESMEYQRALFLAKDKLWE